MENIFYGCNLIKFFVIQECCLVNSQISDFQQNKFIVIKNKKSSQQNKMSLNFVKNEYELSDKNIVQSSKYLWRFISKKYIFKQTKSIKIGGMLRSFFNLALLSRGFSIRILLFQ